ncbi:hypothetical protein ILUMI_06600 [Ignelater luminosus]|uniref:Transposable element P transposase-like RNase H domain-containing protein n=1 Tax=Ignelater luminosus TaxID=2038154 RepID=A0A8K0GCF2_IGNLU|nr:hypothetical protein ILUMI_06600 [Ignelater luminosus]
MRCHLKKKLNLTDNVEKDTKNKRYVNVEVKLLKPSNENGDADNLVNIVSPNNVCVVPDSMVIQRQDKFVWDANKEKYLLEYLRKAKEIRTRKKIDVRLTDELTKLYPNCNIKFITLYQRAGDLHSSRKKLIACTDQKEIVWTEAKKKVYLIECVQKAFEEKEENIKQGQYEGVPGTKRRRIELEEEDNSLVAFEKQQHVSDSLSNKIKKNSDNRPISDYKEKILLLKKKLTAKNSALWRLEARLERIHLISALSIFAGAIKTFRVFIKMQLRKTNRKWDKRGKTAVSLYYKSPAIYFFMRNNLRFQLLSKSTILSWLRIAQLKTGTSTQLVRSLAVKVQQMCQEKKQCFLAFESMKIKKNVEYNPLQDIIEGFEDLGHLGRGEKLATEALVFMIRELFYKWKMPVAYYFISSLNHEDVKRLLEHVISSIHNIGLQVRITIHADSNTKENYAEEEMEEEKGRRAEYYLEFDFREEDNMKVTLENCAIAYFAGHLVHKTINKFNGSERCSSDDQLNRFKNQARKAKGIRRSVHEDLDTDVLTHAIKMQLRASGNSEAAQVLEGITCSRTRAQKYRKAYSDSLQKEKHADYPNSNKGRPQQDQRGSPGHCGSKGIAEGVDPRATVRDNQTTSQNRAETSTSIDVTLALGSAYNMVANWKVESQLAVSDHNLIRYILSKEPLTREQRSNKGRYCVCGPVFWDVMMEELLLRLDINENASAIVAFADDLLLAAEVNSRATLETKTLRLVRVSQ